jgi:hypothetical protein
MSYIVLNLTNFGLMYADLLKGQSRADVTSTKSTVKAHPFPLYSTWSDADKIDSERVVERRFKVGNEDSYDHSERIKHKSNQIRIKLLYPEPLLFRYVLLIWNCEG